MATCKQALFFSLLFVSITVWASPKKLQAARKAYAAGKYAEAADIYEMIDLKSREYLRSREELAWAFLRAGEWQKLRGVLAHLNSHLVPLRWRLEGRVMSAMLHLRECQYERVNEEMKKYQTELAPLIKKINRFVARSPNKAYWTAMQNEVAESILKMKFVKMELRSRLVMLTREQVVDGQSTKGLTEELPKTAQTYPLLGDLWSDEIFQARGDGNSACPDIHRGKVIR